MPTIHDVACTVCGCVCDDLTVHVQNGHVVAADQACSLSEHWWLAQAETGPISPLVAGRPVGYPVAIHKAAELLAASRAPLICGLSASSTAGQRAACTVADHLGATIDTAADSCQTASLLALQAVGQSTASLGEVKNRADLVVYWGCNPVVSHPRHWERTVDTPGLFVPQGRRGRQVLVVDVEQTATADLADRFVQIEPGCDFDLLWALRAAVQGVAFDAERVGGLAREELDSLARCFQTAKYGAFFWGPGLTRHGVPQGNVQALLQLITDLNAHTRAVGCLLGQPSATNVLCWQTGYPRGVNLARGYPRYGPEEYTADVLLSRGEVDAVLFVGREAIGKLSSAARQRLTQIPRIMLEARAGGQAGANPLAADVHFTTASDGVHCAGTVFRLDEVPLPVRAVLPSALPSAAQVLQDIQQALANSDASRGLR